jgi:SAM-dependent methyltransferase
MFRIKKFKQAQTIAVPKIDDYIIRSQNLYDRDSTLQQRFASPPNPEFEKFIDTEAILHYREIQEVGVSFPSSREMLTVGGETDLRIFLPIGYECYQIVKRNIPSDIPSPAKILDFGIGCARSARFFFRDQQKFECFGCDVDEQAIGYVGNSVPFIKATVSRNFPPLPYTDGFFDVIYSISVFTHLNRRAFTDWLQEIHRVLRRGGFFLVTLHGPQAFSLLENDPERRKLLGIAKEFSTSTTFASDGFAWMKQPVGSTSIDTSQFGISFINQEVLRESIDGLFDLVDYRAGEIGGWQDLAVLRRMRD